MATKGSIKKDEQPEEGLILFGQPTNLPAAVQAAVKRYNLKTREHSGVAPTWKPESEGSYVLGEVSSVRHKVGEFESTVITLMTPTGPVAVWLSADLKLKLDGVSQGQCYCITFNGYLRKKDNPKLKNDMKLYTVTEFLR